MPGTLKDGWNCDCGDCGRSIPGQTKDTHELVFTGYCEAFAILTKSHGADSVFPITDGRQRKAGLKGAVFKGVDPQGLILADRHAAWCAEELGAIVIRILKRLGQDPQRTDRAWTPSCLAGVQRKDFKGRRRIS